MGGEFTEPAVAGGFRAVVRRCVAGAGRRLQGRDQEPCTCNGPSGPRLAALFSPVLEKRAWSFVVAAVAVTHMGLVLAGRPGLDCPFRALTGVPCPGCGLSTATAFLLRGEWGASFRAHAFAPLFLAALAVMSVLALAPDSWRQPAAGRIARWERGTRFTTWTAAGMILYWALRPNLFP